MTTFRTAIVFYILLTLLGGFACNDDNSSKTEQDTVATDPPGLLEITVDPASTFQTIRNFGASDAWSVQFVGKNWPESSRRQMARLLFSTETYENGDPKGIGLTAWRFNIGGGSAGQGTASQIDDEWRRAESFIDENETYDWTKQQGQLWFLQEAKALGVQDFIGFVNSPPIVYTKNGKAWSGDGRSSNLPPENYDKYADFLSNVVKGVEEQTGVTFDYISPFNEPQWEWKCCGQEGSPWNNDELAEAVRAIDKAFQANGITSRIEVTEAAQIDFLYRKTGLNGRDDQLDAFFNESSETYIGDLSTVARKIAAHSYFTTWPVGQLVTHRQALSNKLKSHPSLEYWMSEYTLLENNEEVKGSGRNLGMDPALFMARVIHADLVFTPAVAWHWWLAISPYDYKDGLVYIDHNKFSGNIYESKMLWALGHFSRFVRPGMTRIAVSRSDKLTEAKSIDNLLVSAYKSDDEMVLVLVNQLNREEVVRISGLSTDFNEMKVYQTTAKESDNLSFKGSVKTDEVIKMPKRSLVTLVAKRQ